MLRPFAALFVVVGFVLGSQVVGCAGLLSAQQAACADVTPVLDQGPTYLADFEISLDAAAAISGQLSAADQATVLALVAKGRTTLSALATTIDGLQAACTTAPDWAKLFADVIAIWTDIHALIGKAGISASPRSAVPDPILWTRVAGGAR